MSKPNDEFRDRETLEAWLAAHESDQLVLANAKLPDFDFSNLDLSGANFNEAVLDGSDFRGSTLKDATLSQASLVGVNLDGASLEGSSMAAADLSKASLRGGIDASDGKWNSVQLREVDAQGIRLTGAHLDRAECGGADFRGASFVRSVSQNVRWTNADLRGATFVAAHLTGSTWHGARIDRLTVFTGSVWKPTHDASNDGASTIRVGLVVRWVNWRWLRVIGRVPLFAGSYAMLAVGLATATALQWINEGQFAFGLSYPVPIPPRLALLLAGSSLLAIGATIFEVSCPSRVKEFSLTQWIEELRRPGALYISDTLQRPIAAGTTMVLVGLGGAITVYLFAERLWAAFSFILQSVAGRG